MKKEKYGFVYIWYDCKYPRYYIGSHWGYENDGYICSSTRMRNAYKRRPNDFKRRIISIIKSNRSDLLDKEFEWLSLIENCELGKKYYNLTQHKNGHWTAESYHLSIREKISKAHNRPETKEKTRLAKLGNKNPMKRPEIAEKVAAKNRGRVPWNKGITKNDEKGKNLRGNFGPRTYPSPLMGRKANSETRKKISEGQKGMIWIYNSDIDKSTRIHKNQPIPNGFKRGRKPNFLTHTKETKIKIGLASKGSKYYHHKENFKIIRLKPEDKIPINFIKGMK